MLRTFWKWIWLWLCTTAKLSVGIWNHSLIISELLSSLKHSSCFFFVLLHCWTLIVILPLAKLTGDNTACSLTASSETSANILGFVYLSGVCTSPPKSYGCNVQAITSTNFEKNLIEPFLITDNDIFEEPLTRYWAQLGAKVECPREALDELGFNVLKWQKRKSKMQF